MAIIMHLINLLVAFTANGERHRQSRVRAGTHPHCHRWWALDCSGLGDAGQGTAGEARVTVEIVQIASSPVAIQAMLSGEVEAIVTSAASLVTSRLAGADVTMIMSTSLPFRRY